MDSVVLTDLLEFLIYHNQIVCLKANKHSIYQYYLSPWHCMHLVKLLIFLVTQSPWLTEDCIFLQHLDPNGLLVVGRGAGHRPPDFSWVYDYQSSLQGNARHDKWLAVVRNSQDVNECQSLSTAGVLYVEDFLNKVFFSIERESLRGGWEAELGTSGIF